MRAELRPSSLGEILDRTAQMYRSHFLLYFGIAAISYAATSCSQPACRCAVLFSRACKPACIYRLQRWALGGVVAVLTILPVAIAHGCRDARRGAKLSGADVHHPRGVRQCRPSLVSLHPHLAGNGYAMQRCRLAILMGIVIACCERASARGYGSRALSSACGDNDFRRHVCCLLVAAALGALHSCFADGKPEGASRAEAQQRAHQGRQSAVFLSCCCWLARS